MPQVILLYAEGKSLRTISWNTRSASHIHWPIQGRARPTRGRYLHQAATAFVCLFASNHGVGRLCGVASELPESLPRLIGRRCGWNHFGKTCACRFEDWRRALGLRLSLG